MNNKTFPEFSLTWADADAGRAPCPGCGSRRFPSWTRVRVDEVEVLTHDGDVICPGDPTFGALAGPELLPVVESVEVAA
ncbi:hypothetical protein [Streptomyces sp. WZ-12]|uniref:hypothetical protein n=1 Tax=Streptomyces sp. WZ-12 TaxID=3030210 RepID=UPI00238124B6|nr:hypothetical protein [Streptomyces sp. WZ-12]